MAPTLEVWLRGSIEGVAPSLQPVAHALLQVIEDVEAATAHLSDDALWHSPGGAASLGFHLRHLAGSTSRLFSTARGLPLSEQQHAALERERRGEPEPLADLVRELRRVVDEALEQLRDTDPASLGEPRALGRLAIPTTVGDLLHHAAQHAARHAGQVVTTRRWLDATESA